MISGPYPRCGARKLAHLKESNQLSCPLIAKCHEKHLVWGEKEQKGKNKSSVLLRRRKELPFFLGKAQPAGRCLCRWPHLHGPLTQALVVVSCLAVWDPLCLQVRGSRRQDGSSDMVTARGLPWKDHGGQFRFTFPASLDFILFLQKLWCCLGAFLFYLEREISPPHFGQTV